MLQPGINNEETIRAWAEITINIWRNKIVELKAWDTGELYKSFRYELYKSAGNNVDRIEFSYHLYGLFVDMGVGREMAKGNSGDLGGAVIRQRKEWYSRVFYREVMRLKEILAQKFGEGVAKQLVLSLQPMKDLKYARAKGAV
jgi:hypothetical protein